jgi:HK97 family phage major capsid protein
MSEEQLNNSLKFLSATEDEIRVGNYLVLYGGKDIDGEHFSKKTDFESSYTKTGRLYVDWEHGLEKEPAPNKDEVLGYVDWSTSKSDELGLWVERVLHRRNAYMRYIEPLIKNGLVGNSSEAIPSGVETTQKGEIVKWPLRRDTLTVNPAEPRMMTDNVITAIKALAQSNPNLEALLPEESDDSTRNATEEKAGAITPERTLEVTAMTDDEKLIEEKQEEPEVDNEIKSEKSPEIKKMEFTKEELQELVDGAVTGAVDKAMKALPAVPKDVKVEKDEADQPWDNPGEYFQAVKNASLYPGNEDVRLKSLKAGGTGLSENVPADGGYLLAPQVAGGIIEAMWGGGELLSRVASDPIGPNSNSMLYNAVDESSRAEGSRWGGVRGYWMAEAGTITASQPTFRQMELKLKKVAALCYATDELLADATALESWLSRTVPAELRFQVENAYFQGNGVGKPLGIMNSPALVSVTRIDANEVDETDIANMWARRYAGVNDYVWLANSEVFPQLINLTVGNFPFLLPMNSGGQGNPSFSLYGAPYIETEYSAALGTTGDIMLASLSQYQTINKGGVQAASSIHVNFTSDETAFRFIYRVDGQPLWNAAVESFSASATTKSPFVVLAAASV